MPDVPIAFLNCHELLPPGASKRAPIAPQQLTLKVGQLGQTLANLPLHGVLPAFVGLCEVQSASLALDVAHEAFPDVPYRAVWCRSTPLERTSLGLAILYDSRVVHGPSANQRDAALRHGREAPRWLCSRFEFVDPAVQPVWIIVNHWHSDHAGETDGAYGRRRLADEIGDLFRGRPSLRSRRRSPVLDFRSDRVVLIGDFNCEPSDRVFRPSSRVGWTASPNRDAVRSAPLTRPLFFNPIWKAPDVYGTFAVDHRGLDSRMIDQLLFSRELCGSHGLRFKSGSLVTSPPIGQATDHAAIAAVLEY